MQINPENVGKQIAALRKAKLLTQNELGERLNISFQAISKWERGETLPDTSILLDLAAVLETTVDNILNGGAAMEFKGKLAVKDMKEGVSCLERMGRLLGRQNILYRGAVDGLSEKINSDVESMLEDEFLKECLTAEAVIGNMRLGYYFDLTDVKNNFKYEKWVNEVAKRAAAYGIS